LIVFIRHLVFGRAPPAGGPGFPFQVLAIRASWLWAFHYNPSRGYMFQCSEFRTSNVTVNPCVRDASGNPPHSDSVCGDWSGPARRSASWRILCADTPKQLSI